MGMERPGGWLLTSEKVREELGPELPQIEKVLPLMELITQVEGLYENQRNDLAQLIYRFQDVFSDKPGRTKGVVHRIQTPQGAIVREQW